MKKHLQLILLAMLVLSCGNKKQPQAQSSPATTKQEIQAPQFNGDSAYQFVADQVAFGPRVPGSEASKQCLQYYEEKLNTYGAQVLIQSFVASGFDGTQWQGNNVVASFNPTYNERIMLCAHWDSRFIAEEDKDKTRQEEPIDGANDGASGVGVLLELARQFQIQAPNVGVDLVFFDVEDQGAPSHLATAETTDSWCLGSQYWAKEAAKSSYNARWGILLDMVGAPDAVFYREQISQHFAGQLVDYVWSKAEELGYAHLFVNTTGGIVTDDHLYVNRISGVPCIDIIDYNNQRGFNRTWHTHDDNMDNISKEMLQQVGDVVLAVIYEQ